VAYGAGGGAVVLLIALGVSQLEPAAPAVDRSTLWVDTVRRGAMVREVRGTGTLVPEDTRWIPATTMGRVERIVLRPGTAVGATALILELSNPTLEQELTDARLKLKSAEANLTTLRVLLETEELQQQASTASIEADYK
jgi:HlyD family secretion protein